MDARAAEGTAGGEGAESVGGGDRIHSGNARKSGRDGAQYLAQCVGKHILPDVNGAWLALVVRQ